MHPTVRTILAALGAAVVAGLALGAAAPAAGAQTGTDDGTRDNLIVVTGRAEVREGRTVDNVIIADGPIVIDGTVRDAVFAVRGNVLIRGTARHDVVALDGRVTVASSGHVRGDVVSRHRPIVQSGGRLDGSWQRWNPRSWSRATAVATRLALWFTVSVSSLLLGLLLWLIAPRAAFAVHTAARTAVGPAIGWGLLLALGLPLAALLAIVTLVGLPLGLGLLAALALLYGIAYTASAWLLGRSVASAAHPLLSFLAGWGILRVIALVPILGGLAWIAAVVFGLGAIGIAAWRARRPAGVPPDAAPVTGPPAVA